MDKNTNAPEVAETKPKKVTFEDTIQEINRLLISHPHAVKLGLFKNDEYHYYRFNDNTVKANEIRKEIHDLLNTLYQSGVYNYQQFADALRLEILDIQGLMDEEFIQKNNL